MESRSRKSSGRGRSTGLQLLLAAVLLAGLFVFASWSYRRVMAYAAGANEAVGKETPPRLRTKETRRDYGRVQRGRSLRAGFVVQNHGGRRLILARQKNKCGCVAGEAEIVIAPGGQRRVLVTLDTSEFHGLIAVPVHYQTNDPSHPLAEFQLRADVVEG